MRLGDIDAKGLTVWHGEAHVNCPFAVAENMLSGAEMIFLDAGHSVAAYHEEN